MTTTDLPPIGSVWVNKKNPHDIAIVRGYDTIQLKHSGSPHNLLKIHKLINNSQTVEVTSTFTWTYKPLSERT